MPKKILIHVLIGVAMFIVGGSLHDFANIKGPGSFIGYVGIIYALLAILFLVLLSSPIKNIISSLFISKAFRNISKNKARKELLEYKTLLNEGLITQAEFDKKTEILKEKIL